MHCTAVHDTVTACLLPVLQELLSMPGSDLQQIFSQLTGCLAVCHAFTLLHIFLSKTYKIKPLMLIVRYSVCHNSWDYSEYVVQEKWFLGQSCRPAKPSQHWWFSLVAAHSTDNTCVSCVLQTDGILPVCQQSIRCSMLTLALFSNI